MTDPIAEEVREVRRRLSARFDFDVHRICERVIEQQEEDSGSYVSPRTQPKDAAIAAARDGSDAIRD